MKGSKTIFLAILLSSLFSLSQYPKVQADKGGFSPSGYTVFESGQKAIAAWNGTDEILILSTDVRGSQETYVIEIMPFPAEPTIEEGREGSFRQIESLIRHFYGFFGGFSAGTYRGAMSARSLGDDGRTGVVIVFHESIGAHSITVVEAVDAEELTSWIEDFLSSMEINYSEFPSGLDDLISHYIENEINFFVLDVITVNNAVRSVEPLVYRFKTSKLYYPLRISSLFSGDTEISICTITSGELADVSVLRDGFERVVRFRVKLEALSEIDPVMPQLFNNSPYLCFYEYSGSLSSFENDIKMGFVPFFNLAPFFRVHPLWVAITSTLGAGLMLLFLVTPRRKSLRDITIELSLATIIFVAVALSIDFLVIWLFYRSASVYLDLLVDMNLWGTFILLESIILMLLGTVGYAHRWALDELQHRWFWFSLATAGFALFVLFVYLSS